MFYCTESVGNQSLHYSQDPGNTAGEATPPAVFSWFGLFLEHCSWKSVNALENKYYFTIFRIWFRRPNHNVEQTRIAILCIMAASMSNCLWSEVKFFRKTWKYSSLARMSTLPMVPSWTFRTSVQTLVTVRFRFERFGPLWSGIGCRSCALTQDCLRVSSRSFLW